MKSFELFVFLALLLSAHDFSEASMLARGRSKTKLQDQMNEAPYVCLDDSVKLPVCNFGAETDGETFKKPSRQLRSIDALAESEELSHIRQTEVIHRATTIIYKIEGCIPSRLPFALPLCKTEDSAGRTVEVRKLFPFKVMSPLAQNSGVLPTLVFPEVDMNQWYRFMQGLSRSADNDDDAAQKQSEVATKKAIQQKKAGQANFNDKKTILQNSTEELPPNEIDENDIFSKFRSSFAAEKQLANDRTRDMDTYKTKSYSLNRIVDASQEDGEIDRRMAEKASSAQYHHEFPYAEAIPCNSEKLGVSRADSEFPYTRVIPLDQENLRVVGDGREFPYARAIPYEPEKLRVARVGREFPYNKAISFDPEKLQVARKSSEFPYSRTVPYNPTNLQIARESKEFPYSHATPYNPKKFQVAKRGSGFPYTWAIPYDRNKLEERRSVALDTLGSIPYKPTKLLLPKRGSEIPYTWAIPYDLNKLKEGRNVALDALGSLTSSSHSHKFHEAQAKFQNPRIVPFDTSMLAAAKEGGIFPYGKALPNDTSKITDTMEFPRSSVSEELEIPVRNAKTFWDEQFPTYAKKNCRGRTRRNWRVSR